ncbi:MAG: MCP four helix bundle domain-containing protein [Lachnospiraceae bacterium]|nr:MCP four helix bundle domain-containing protein [Lachnospiraceae bacterium]
MKNFFEKMKIKKRLITSYVMIIGVFGIVSVFIMGALIFMVADYNHVIDHYAFPQGDIGRAMNASAEVRSATRGMVGYDTEEMIAQMTSQHATAVDEFEHYLEELRASCESKEEKEMLAAIDTAWKNYCEAETEIIALGATTDKEASDKAQHMMSEKLEPVYHELDVALLALMDYNVEKGHKEQTRLQILEIVLIVGMVITVVLVLGFATNITAIIAKSIETPLKALEKRLTEFAGGDLSSPFPTVRSKDELADMVKTASDMAERLTLVINDAGSLLTQMAGGNYNIRITNEEYYQGEFHNLIVEIKNMNRQMNETLKNVDEAAKQVAEGSSNMAEAAQNLAEGATEQAATVQEMQATINDLNNGIQTTAEQLGKAYQEARKYAQSAEESRSDMEELMGAMRRISDSSEKIGAIISEIEDIASQTNLLSLNASIEAARAGEAGRGFAVVADQIRNLAEQSAQSAVDSRNLIEASIREVEEGNRVAMKSADSLRDVVSGVHSIADSAKKISEISNDQANAMDQADMGINRIAEVVQSNSATAEELSATSEELTAQAVTLSEMIDKFELQ